MSSTTWLADISAPPGRFTGQPQRGGRSDPDMAPTVRRNRQAFEFAASGPGQPRRPAAHRSAAHRSEVLVAQTSPLAGKPAPADILVDVDALIRAYYDRAPDPGVPAERVSFGTSGHRGSSLAGTFNERHILAISQAICEYRQRHGIDGPLFVGVDTHALSEPALRSALEVLAANNVQVRLEATGGPTPTPVISHAILAANRGGGGGAGGQADGIVI